jgi:predicted membrane protein DUF2157
MNPDVVAAIARLRREDVLSSGQAILFDRVAGRRLVSVRLEIRTLLYVGVLLLTSGVGLFVVEHHRNIGPWAIAGALALAVVACLVWVVRNAPPFSWSEAQSPSVAFDYVLLLGLLLLASDLAYVEAQFTVLGRNWPHHLLVVGVVYLLAAYRWDSRMVLGLAVATLAAWRGVSIGVMSRVFGTQADDLRWNAVALGAIYVALAALSVRLRRKSHFEEVFGTAGLLLLLGALVSGVLDSSTVRVDWVIALLAAAGLVMWVSLRLGRSLYFAQGVLAAYVGLLRLLFAPFSGAESSVPFFVAGLLGIGALVLIFGAHRRMVER